jgi:hypothetical protein
VGQENLGRRSGRLPDEFKANQRAFGIVFLAGAFATPLFVAALIRFGNFGIDIFLEWR